MLYARYQNEFLNLADDWHFVAVAGYGEETSRAAAAAAEHVRRLSLNDLHKIAVFIEDAVESAARKLLVADADLQAWLERENVLFDPDKIGMLRQIEGDVDLWLRASETLEPKSIPCDATPTECLCVLALWKAHAHSKMNPWNLLAQGERPAKRASRSGAPQAKVEHLIRHMSAMIELTADVCRAATMAQMLAKQRKERSGAGRSGAAARAKLFATDTEKVVEAYEQRRAAYDSLSVDAVTDDIYLRIGKDLSIASSTVRSKVAKYKQALKARTIS